MAVSERTEHLSDELNAGLTLPADWYTDQAVLDLERELIFRSAWRFGGLARDVAEPGQYATRELGGVPVVVVRDKAGVLRAFVNVCRHRASVVASGCGHAKTLQCPYHAWTYDLDGSLRAAPRSEREPSFDRSGLGLVPVQVATWGPLLFLNLDPDAPPLEEHLGALPEILAGHGVEVAGLAPHSTTHFDMRANWKAVTENYLECYHCPVAHKGFTQLLETGPQEYTQRTDGNLLISETPLRAKRGRGAPKIDTAGVVERTRFDLLWPTTTFNVFPGASNLLLFWFEPVSPTRTIGAFEYFFGDDADDEYRRDLIAFFDEVGGEDVHLVESVQRGLDSGQVRQGRLLPDSEGLIQVFHRRVYESLRG